MSSPPTFAMLNVFVAVLLTTIACAQPAQPEPTPGESAKSNRQLSDVDATFATRQTFQRVATFSDDTRAGILSGQNIGHTAYDCEASFQQTWTKLNAQRQLPAPAIMAIDFGLGHSVAPADSLIDLLVEHARRGGIVSVSTHPPNPWTDGSYDDMKRGTFSDLMTPGTEAYQRWTSWRSKIADVLKRLAERDVPVLWRPLHEANGDWFWWCVAGGQNALTPEEFRRLWRDLYSYLHRERQLHNLIWIYSANARTSESVRPLAEVYPGNDVVDVVGIDYYGPNVQDLNKHSCYDNARRLGKVVALSEFGSEPMDGTLDAERWVATIRERYPAFAYFLFWHSWPDHAVALADINDAKQILTNPFVVNRNSE